MAWRELILDDDLIVFTTAELRWRPLRSEDPEGGEIATLWGDPESSAFGAVVRRPDHPPNVYTLIRRSSQRRV